MAMFGHAGSLEPVRPAVVVFLQTDPSQDTVTVDAMKLEVGAQMSHVGYRVEWLGSQRGAVSDTLVVAKLRGSCMAPQGSANSAASVGGRSLATSQVIDERIEPFVSLNCSLLNSFLSSSPLGPTEVQRNESYGRAMGRLLAHELYHILAQTSHHSKTGVARANVTPAELLADHFDFDREASTLLRAAVETSIRQAKVMAASDDDHGL